MELFKFNQILKDLSDYYERGKEPKHGTMELWYEKIKFIPAEPIPWMLVKIMAENDSYPKNIPAAIWGAYREWMSAHPERVIQKVYRDCPDCTDGIIAVRKGVKGNNRQSAIARCGLCKQSKVEAYPMYTRQQLIAGGYEVIPKSGDPDDGSVKYRNVAKLISDVGVGGALQ